MVQRKSFRGLFVGLVTLDLIYLADSPPKNNQKLVATNYTVAAGGPATNAAVTFSHLGNQAQILGVLGTHPLTSLIRQDLANYQVTMLDLDPTVVTEPPVSSIIVTQASGERAIISINAVKIQGRCTDIPANILSNVDIVLIDGHLMAVGKAIATLAHNLNIPVAIDGGSWKSGFGEILPFVDYAICSANFHPPDCRNPADIFAYLKSFDIPEIAITQGEQPIQYYSRGKSGKIDVPQIPVVDTLGAGDIFHGAFCDYILRTSSFTGALAAAANIASKACKSFGTRSWMKTD